MESSTTSAGARARVVLVASPGAGHLIPMAELARRVVAHPGLPATLVAFAGPDGDALSAVLSSLRDAGVDTSVLPAVPLDDLPADARVETVVSDLISRSVLRLRALLRDVATTAPLAALLPDLFAASVLALAAELGVPGYLFFPGSLSALYVLRRAVELNDGGATAGEYRDLPDPLQLPGGVSLRRADMPDGFRNSKKPAYGLLVEDYRRQYRSVGGFLVNTFYEMDPAAVEEFKQAAEQGTFPPAYPVGPLVRSSSDEEAASPCMEWLDRQPTGSVVHVSFGSAGALSVEQTAELAAGLEDSGHRFLWVVCMPSLDGENSDSGKSRRRRGEDDDPLAWLPEGFLERTSGRGLAVAACPPQSRVLSHPATAVFVSHCGWNSALESVASGVPMVSWPLDAEQRMNAAVLSESAGVALRPARRPRGRRAGRARGDRGGGAGADGAGEGRAVLWRTGDLRQAADKAWAPEGSSRRALEEVAGRWKWKAVALGMAKERQ
ncbi:hypothetical protein SETIT_1G021000v2 [Setaria italica]|uniref:Glycosyltransferase n=2 Tax=Setaria italica TaxID=4555 RepID=A0A368PGZ2_SETIT|nr:hypothetical protein SETIT_1G021000v2 [Setaria italica]